MFKENNKWTSKEILKGKTLYFIVLTLLSAYIMNSFADKALTYLLNINNKSIMTYNYSLGISGIILVIPAALLSIFIIKTILKIKGTDATASYEEPISHRSEREQIHEKQFKWYSVYGVVLGYFFMGFIFNIGDSKWSEYIQATGAGEINPVLEGGGYIIIMIASIILTVTVVKIINTAMIEVTNTNKEVLKDIGQGIYDSDFSNIQEKNETIKVIQIGRVSSVKGALKYIQVQRWLKTVGKGSTAIAGFLFIATFGVMNLFMESFMSATENAGSELEGNINKFLNDAFTEGEEEKKARKHAEEEQHKANYSRQQYIKQHNYNPKYAQSDRNRAIADQRKANDARNEYYKTKN